MSTEPSRVSLPLVAFSSSRGHPRQQPQPQQRYRDWESEVLQFLRSNDSAPVPLSEILRHFTRSVGEGESEHRQGEVAQEIRQAVRSLGERCCLYLDQGGYCASV
jgi:hypothetical protein